MWSRLDFDITNLFYEGLDKINKNVLSSSETTFADLQMAGGQSLIAVVKLLRKFGFDDDNIRKRVFGFSENGLYLSIVKEELKDLEKCFESEENKIIIAKKEYEDAIKIFTNAIDIAPLNSQLLNNRGLALMESGKYSEAIIDLEKSVSINKVFIFSLVFLLR